MFVSLDEFFQKASEKVRPVDIFFVENNFRRDVHADHICFKCESHEEFETLRKMFEQSSQYIFQSIISERRIALVKFNKPIETVLGPISILELSDQKPDGSQKSGFDHIEIYPVEKSMEELVARLEQKGILVHLDSKPHHTTWEFLVDGFKIRIEPCPLMEKVAREEMA